MAEIAVISAAAEQKSIVANLLELYAHDFSGFHELHLGEDGRFGYPDLPLYWQDANRHPFLVRVDGRLAGLALIRKGSQVTGNEAVWDMAEFFVVRGHRRRGIGTQVAHQVWRRLPGWWEIRVMQANAPALEFWERAVQSFTGKSVPSSSFDGNGACWNLFSFESPSCAASDFKFA